MRVSSCCCFSLRTGTLILGYLGLIGCILSSLICLVCIVFARSVVEELMKDQKFSQASLDEGILALRIMLGVAVVFCLIGIIIYGLLLVGVYKQRPKLIKIYLIFAIIGCVLLALSAIGYLLSAFSAPELFGRFISQSLALALNVYYLLVVNSYRLQVIQETSMKRDGSNLPRQF